MGFVVRTALGPDGAALRIGRGLRMGRDRRSQQDGCHRRPKRRCMLQRIDHLNKSLLLMQELPLQPKSSFERFARKRLTGWSIFSFEFHRKRIVLSCGAESLLKRPS
jgi:hypothetical protein